ncbi:M81 family metallopeptidase [Cupriavidus plantarum]|uniref:M81 family metallopeptidase n=1 Tax=Cupriavidus plantarum TaxID=942865 RepID=UPI001B254560|nr:M81 family metallopeptidase [Cupriavidus plantarum]CAG2128857.1 hypothetical protein LMG26296_01458 [Cupriavidus plantarum]SMR66408.1 Microcystin degradation protein MlrC, contains DUF1485 domain [Cupriavidus plantarum]
MKRILIAGFQHETNTFAPTKATYESFERGESFPAMRRGDAILELRDVNLPVGGFLRRIRTLGHAVQPVIWAGASPSAHVTEDAFERIAAEIVDAAKQIRPEGVYLDLHGAAVCEHLDDPEGELLARLRDAVGPDVRIVASLDLHANVTSGMLGAADALVGYRTYPHIDLAATGARAADLLHRLLEHPGPWHLHARRVPFLIPINAMCTQTAPAADVYAELARLETGAAVESLSFTPGFPAADIPECGGVVWGYGADASAVAAAVDRLHACVTADESAWDAGFLTPEAAVARAQEIVRNTGGPVIIADTQDNPGAGADSNTMGMVRALLAAGATNAAVGLIWDPEAARMAHAAGVGARTTLSIGGKSGVAGDAPLIARCVVRHLSDGKLRYDGVMKHGLWTDIGPVAGLEVDGVTICVCSVKSQVIDRNLIRAAGVEPAEVDILVVKSSVHFRADFEPIARAVLVAKAPGPMAADPGDLPWRRLRPGMRVRPNGPAFLS